MTTDSRDSRQKVGPTDMRQQVERNHRADGPSIGVNPYGYPIVRFVAQLKQIDWSAPYVPQFALASVLVLVIVVQVILYATVGIVAQISGVFIALIADARRQMEDSPGVGKAAYVIAIGIYASLVLPLLVVQAPFWLLGKAFEHFVIVSVSLAVVTVIGLGIYASNGSPQEMLSGWVQSLLGDLEE